nr:hypothetical protein [Tanacetum cinerariifolium]
FKLSLKDCPIRDCDVERMSKVPYVNAIRSLMYLMVCTRPHIAYAVSIVSRYLANSGLIYGTNRGNHKDLIGFVDSDYAKDPDKEAEYMALTEAMKESIWLKGLLKELGSRSVRDNFALYLWLSLCAIILVKCYNNNNDTQSHRGRVGGVYAFTIDEFFSSYGNVNVPKPISCLWQAVVWTTGYFVWKERNTRVLVLNGLTTLEFSLSMGVLEVSDPLWSTSSHCCFPALFILVGLEVYGLSL